MKIFKNKINNTIILIILILIFVFCYLDYSKNISEGYLFPDCISNTSFNSLNKSDFQSISKYNSTFHSCKDPSTNFYISANTNIPDLFDVSAFSATSELSCQEMAASDTSYDFYTFNTTNQECSFYELCGNIYNTDFTPEISTMLYMTCSAEQLDNDQNFNKKYQKLGSGAFSKSGYKLMKDNHFQYVSYANTSCANDYAINTDLEQLKTCINNAKTQSTVSDKLSSAKSCFNTLGNKIINTISGDYSSQFFADVPQSFNREQTQQDLRDNDYINNVYNKVKEYAISEASYNNLISNNNSRGEREISGGTSFYQSTLDKNTETHLEYKSTHLRNLFVIIVFIITTILVLLSVTNPNIVSVELLIIYVIFIVLLIFIGSKYLNIFEDDTNKWRKSINQWFQKNILNN